MVELEWAVVGAWSAYWGCFGWCGDVMVMVTVDDAGGKSCQVYAYIPFSWTVPEWMSR